MRYKLPENLILPFIKLKEAQKQLKLSFPAFNFTLDGKLIGDIGEALVSHYCDTLTKLREGSHIHDFVTSDDLNIQVKTTQKDIVGMGRTYHVYEHLIILRIYDNASFEVNYDGPGSLVAHLYNHGNNVIILNRLTEYNSPGYRKILIIDPV